MYTLFSRESRNEMFSCSSQMTSPQWQNLEQREAYQRLIETVSVLHRLATRLSSRAEIVGAVRQVRLHKHVQMTESTVDSRWQIKRKLHCVNKHLVVLKIRSSLGCLGAAGMYVWQHLKNYGEDFHLI